MGHPGRGDRPTLADAGAGLRSQRRQGIEEGGTIEASVELRPEPASAGVARRFVGSTLDEWQLPEVVDVVILLASELVTNAILHARSPMELRLVTFDARVRVEVHDSSPIEPVLRIYEDEAMTGRGLALVESFSSRWGVEPDREGKAVWFEVPTGR